MDSNSDIPCRKELIYFAELQELALIENDHKTHWSTMSDDRLFHLLMKETAELFNAISQWDSEDVIDECVDVANFAMMIADNRMKGGDTAE